ncbi:MAG: molybdenum cofactor biosysynthesis protein [Rhodobacteraceae bacterium]|nr:molybdenum cofactor biosysynthesis protein [Paracoccaceae bacterium]MBT26096.1 molybdenum cofactor biosysynthesis protein [Paracoccaceae bacterium]
MSRLAHIVRHPIKSVGYEEIESASLTKGRALPFDRHWAIAHEAASFGAQPTQWASKRNFVRGAAGHPLMAIRAQTDTKSGTVTLTHPQAQPVTLDPLAQADQLIDWIRPFWPDTRPAPASVVHLPDQPFGDMPDPFVSLLSLSSLRALSHRSGADLSIHRFRGNLWAEDWPPFHEFDLIGKTLRIGGAQLRVVARITRCQATTVNPNTGRSDVDTLGALNRAYDHQDFGVFALITQSGPIARNDAIEVL